MTDLALTRRGLITGLIAFVAAPAIVRAGSLMPVKLMVPTPLPLGLSEGVVYYRIYTGGLAYELKESPGVIGNLVPVSTPFWRNQCNTQQ